MKLYEYQGKLLFRGFGIPIPDGFMISSIGDFDGKTIDFPAVVKAQVLVGGRGKAGGIKFVDDMASAKSAAGELLSTALKGLDINHVLVEQKLDIAKELYLSIAIDTSRKCPVIMASSEGGVDIESVAESKICMQYVDPIAGYQPPTARALSDALGLDPALEDQFALLLSNLYQLFWQKDAELVEINPLVITRGNKLVAADSKVIIDDDALFRQADIPKNYDDLTTLEKDAKEKGYTFIELDGTVGVMANGAGLTMATLDTLLLDGLKPRNFLDLGGTDNPDTVKNAFPLVLNAKPKLIFVNVFGGVTKCDTVAAGIIAAIDEYQIRLPIIVRLAGVREEEGRKMLTDRDIHAFVGMNEAVQKVVEIARQMI